MILKIKILRKMEKNVQLLNQLVNISTVTNIFLTKLKSLNNYYNNNSLYL